MLAVPALTATWTLDAVLTHLADDSRVDGILLIGSLAADTFHQSSDYDLVLVLNDLPQDLSAGVTSIDHRLADLLFVAPAALERIAALSGAVPLNDPLAPLIRWLQHGQIVLDRSQRLALAQHQVGLEDWIATYPDDDLFGNWFATNYNLSQTRRLLASNDPLYQLAADVRMATHGHMQVWYSYFIMRRIADAGEKDALRYLQQHDPAFLEQYHGFVHEANPAAKLERYTQTAAYALAPFGGLWDQDVTVASDRHILEYWQQLFAGG